VTSAVIRTIGAASVRVSFEILDSRCDGSGVGLPGMRATVPAMSRAMTSQSSQKAGTKISRQMTIAS